MKFETNANQYIGQKFGKLTVLGYFKNEERGGLYYFNVKCDCGIEKSVLKKSVLKGDSKSCGSCPKNDIDQYIGQRFGKLVVSYWFKNDVNGRMYFNVKCDCGATKEVRTDAIISGITTTCGGTCGKSNAHQYIGQKFGRLTVLDWFKHSEDHRVYFKLQCDCGSQVEIQKRYLIYGNVTNCGCLPSVLSDVHDYIGKKIGRLSILGYYKNPSDNKMMFEIECDCGKKFNSSKTSVVQGITQSCGCGRLKNAAKEHEEHIGKTINSWTILSYSHKGKVVYFECQCKCGKIKTTTKEKVLSGRSKSCGCSRLENVEQSASKAVFNYYRSASRTRGYTFDLSEEEFSELITKDCFYCGNSSTNTRVQSGFEFKYNGIDRVDNSQGYSTENCVPCCKYCNYMKRSMTQEEFYDQITRIFQHRILSESDPIAATMRTLNPASLESLIIDQKTSQVL